MTQSITYYRQTFDLLDPNPDDVKLADIAHNLARIYRFNGGTSRPISVAEHSLYVMSLVGDVHKFQALMHDAPEAYIGDIIQPVKMVLGNNLQALEEKVWAAICEALNLSPYIHEEVHWADRAAYIQERQELVPGSFYDDPDYDDLKRTPRARRPLLNLSIEEAEAHFLEAARFWRPHENSYT